MQKQEWLDMLAEASTRGVSRQRVCATVGLSVRRVQAWCARVKAGRSLMDRPGGPREAPHRLLLSEKKAILARAALEAHADASSRVLAYQALDEGVFAVSPSSVYRTLAAEALAVVRGPARRKARTTKPLREELTGPNQRWCWDISYLRTPSKRSFLFLYVMLDEWSRKVVAWLVAEFESYELGKILMDRALASEGLQSSGARLPVVINDRGASMKAKNLKQFFVDLGVTQRFSRPRTPDDNPFVEAHFRTVKYHPQYPEHFEDVVRAVDYFTWFFEWYNEIHLHSRIGFVPPALKHAGLADRILERRRERLTEARSRRLTMNRRASTKRVAEGPSQRRS
jgi:transposase InsO family protein